MNMTGMDALPTKMAEWTTARPMLSEVSAQATPLRKVGIRFRGGARVAVVGTTLLCSFALCFALGGCAGGKPVDSQSSVRVVEEEFPAAKAGTVSLASNGLNCKVVLRSARQVGDEALFEYGLSVSNPGEPLEEWSVSVPFSGAVTFVDGQNAEFVASGNALGVSGKPYNSLLPDGHELVDIVFQVKGSPDLVVVPAA